MTYSAVEQAHDLLGLTYAEAARAIKADESAIHRWRAREVLLAGRFERLTTMLAGFNAGNAL